MLLLLLITASQVWQAQAQQVTSPTVSLSINENLTSFSQLVGLIQKAGGYLLVTAGALIVFFLILGGIRYLVSAGNQEQAAAAKKTILNALIGLVVIILSYFLVNVVIGLLS